MVIAPNSDGKPRFCVDYRRLNEISVKGTYSLPRMDDCIELLGEATVLPTMDCNSGYWQIPVAVEDREIFTFTCYEMTFRYVRLPFGLTNSTATFQRALAMLLAWVKWTTCLVYLDDILVLFNSAHEHMQHMRDVLAKVQWGRTSSTMAFQNSLSRSTRTITHGPQSRRKRRSC